ncbi:DUF1810 family protein [Mycobacterium tilburgii]|uniref:DUF1810 family protein n=1 Tax=Mycobacterium tilburgii TaxID=44467 RepID=UPI001183A98C|nr:DUF1810 family protein [Mycobacterium tilburgii]
MYRSVVEECGPAPNAATGCGSSFPQLRGLGSSPTALKYGIMSLSEAWAYLAHEVPDSRLHKMHAAGQSGARGRSVTEIFGSPDDLKLCSSMMLFALRQQRSSGLHRGARHLITGDSWIR